MIRQLLMMLIFAGGIGASTGSAWGQTTYTWVGDSAPSNPSTSWNRKSNYSGPPTKSPTSGDTINFGTDAASNRRTVSLFGQRQITQLNISSNGYLIENGGGGSFSLEFTGTVGSRGVNVANAVSATFNTTIIGGDFVKSGDGKMILGTPSYTSGPSSFTGVTVSAGTLQLGSANVLPDAASVTLSGGTLALSSATDSTGPLELTANSTISVGTGSITFNGLNYTGGTLFIQDWTGPAYGAGTAGRIYFTGIGTDPNTTFGTTFLQNVQFESYGPGGFFREVDLGTGTYELVAAPEPTTVLALGALGLAAFGRLRRRKGAAEAAPEPNVALAV